MNKWMLVLLLFLLPLNLSAFPYVCVIEKSIGYKLDSNESNDYSNFMNHLDKVSPIYKRLDGWEGDISKIKTFKDLPKNAKQYIDYLESFLNTKITIISIGPERNQIIKI